MSLSGSQGFVGLATQSAMAVAPAEGAYTYFEALAAPMVPRDISRVRRPTIGDQPLPRGAYKVGTSVGGSLGIEATPNALGKLLFLMLGYADTPVVDGDAQDHVLRLDPSNQYHVPYFTVRRGIGTSILESSADSKFAQAVVSFAPGDSVQAALNYVGRVPSQALSYPAAVNEVQTISLLAAASGGTFTIITENGETEAIAWNATPATLATNIQTALNRLDIYGTGGIGVTTNRQGTGSVSEIQHLTISALGGTFTLITDAGTTAAITWSGTPATLATNIQNALNHADIYNTGGVAVTYVLGEYVVTWAANGNHDLLVPTISGLLGAAGVNVAYVNTPAASEIYTATWVDTLGHPLMVGDFTSFTGGEASPLIAASVEGSSGITYDDGPVLIVGSEDAEVTLETSTGVYHGADDGVIVMGVEISFGNMLTPPTRLRVGSPYPIDFTLLDREIQIRMQLEIDDPTLYRKVFNAGTTGWSPEPWIGGFHIKAVSGERPFTLGDASSAPYHLVVDADRLHFQTMLIANEPQRVVEATLTATVLKAAGGEEPIRFELRTDRETIFV